jgi:signal transduction histidine kinase
MGEEVGQRDELDDLRAEVAELQASRERLVLAADADLRRIERMLHQGVQQHLVALAVRLQLAEPLLDSNPAAAKAALDELGRDVQHAVDDAARLAQRIRAPRPELGGLAAVLRAVAASAGARASVDVSAGSTYPPEVVQTIYACWLDALEDAGETAVAIAVHEEDGAVTFEVVRTDGPSLDALRDRVEALGGRLEVRPAPEGAVTVSGRLPLSRPR